MAVKGKVVFFFPDFRLSPSVLDSQMLDSIV